ncbi:MAG TPA: hypothetical protein VGK74_00445 [Symbiobacteriaceae bacterium]
MKSSAATTQAVPATNVPVTTRATRTLKSVQPNLTKGPFIIRDIPLVQPALRQWENII